MKRVIGLGGIFFKAKDPKALYEWYRQHLGIESAADGSGAMWRDADHPEVPGCNVWAIFPQETKYFAPSQSSFMINFRVENLDELLKALREEGVQVDPKVEEEPSTGSSRGSWIRRGIAWNCGNRRRQWLVDSG